MSQPPRPRPGQPQLHCSRVGPFPRRCHGAGKKALWGLASGPCSLFSEVSSVGSRRPSQQWACGGDEGVERLGTPVGAWPRGCQWELGLQTSLPREEQTGARPGQAGGLVGLPSLAANTREAHRSRPGGSTAPSTSRLCPPCVPAAQLCQGTIQTDSVLRRERRLTWSPR